MSRNVWILDAGHGGIVKGKYSTAPAKMYIFPDGVEVYEGVINRQILNKIIVKLEKLDIDFAIVSDECSDNSLESRVKRANNIVAKGKKCIYLSIHSNAGGGSGFEVFTMKGESKADKLAEVFAKMYKDNFEFPFRSDTSDGDLDKEANFYVLKHTACPAILVENLFFDNRKEAEYLMSDRGQQAIANGIVQAIMEIENTY